MKPGISVSLRTACFLTLFALLLSGVKAPVRPPHHGSAEKASQEGVRILVYTHTNGYRHQSIERGAETLRELAEQEGYALLHTEDSLQFHPGNLSKYQLVVFLSTTGDVLGPEQESAFQAFIRNGGSFMGIHAATDTEYDWPWYGDLVGAYFESHPEQQEARLEVTDAGHPATAHLPEAWVHYDEWYNFKGIRPGLNVLLNLDEKSYQGGTNGDPHPIAWYREFDGGRMFYTGLGHTNESFEDRNFRKHLLGGMRYCLGIP